MSNHNTSRSVQEKQYERCIAKANKLLSGSLNAYKRAYKLQPSTELKENIRQIETVNEYSEKCNLVYIGNGLYLPKKLCTDLLPHQKKGVRWLLGLYCRQQGGILADDEGMGKIIQVTAFLSGMFDVDKVKSVLIICPKPKISSWQEEFRKWVPELKVEGYFGKKTKKRDQSVETIQKDGGVLLTTYSMAQSHQQQLDLPETKKFEWDYIILDEGHKIRNPNETTGRVLQLSAKNRIILTSKPIQNKLQDLWYLFEFLFQGRLLGTRAHFIEKFENPITNSLYKDADSYEKTLGEKKADKLKKVIEPFFLRRTNDTDQTKKKDLVIWLLLSETQMRIYKKFLTDDDVEELLMDSSSNLEFLTVLRKICDHPRLFSEKAVAKLGLNRDLKEPNLGSVSAVMNIDNVKNNVLIKESGKLKFLIQLLDKLKIEGHRSIVFSQFSKMLDIIQKIIRNKGHKVIRVDGTVPQSIDKAERIAEFQTNSSYSVILLTTEVAVDQTLNAADRVIIYDPDWNPATDAQAVETVFRNGQNKDVVIYRLITCDTVEENMYRRQIFKDSLSQLITGATKYPQRYFSKSELHELFILDNPRVSTTQEQLQQMHCNQRKSDVSLDDHKSFLHSLDIFGISDHDLMFTKEAEADEAVEDSEHAESTDYIQNRIYGEGRKQQSTQRTPSIFKPPPHLGNYENTPDVGDSSCSDSAVEEETSTSFQFVSKKNDAADAGAEDDEDTPVKKTARRRSVCRKRVVESSDEESVSESRPSSTDHLSEQQHKESVHMKLQSPNLSSSDVDVEEEESLNKSNDEKQDQTEDDDDDDGVQESSDNDDAVEDSDNDDAVEDSNNDGVIFIKRRIWKKH